MTKTAAVRTEGADDGVKLLLKQKSAEPRFATGRAKPAKAARKSLPATTTEAPLMRFTNYRVTTAQRGLLRQLAFDRANLGLTPKADASAVLRDILDYFEAHQDAVLAWCDRQPEPRGRRR